MVNRKQILFVLLFFVSNNFLVLAQNEEKPRTVFADYLSRSQSSPLLSIIQPRPPVPFPPPAPPIPNQPAPQLPGNIDTILKKREEERIKGVMKANNMSKEQAIAAINHCKEENKARREACDQKAKEIALQIENQERICRKIAEFMNPDGKSIEQRFRVYHNREAWEAKLKLCKRGVRLLNEPLARCWDDARKADRKCYKDLGL